MGAYKKIVVFLFVSFLLLSASAALAQEYQASGPIAVTNQHPFYVYFLNPVPDKVDAVSEDKWTIDLRHTMANINVRQYSYPPAFDHDRVELDMEIHKLDLDFKYAINEKMSLQLNIPYLLFWEGFLDSVITSMEDVLSVTVPSAREDWGMNEHRYFLRYSDKTYIDHQSQENGLGDISCLFKYKLIDQEGSWPSIALRTGIKLPSGSEDELLGSGELDYQLGCLLQKQINKLFLYLNLDAVFIGHPDFLDTMPLDDCMLSGFLGLEYFLNQKLSLLLQGDYLSTPYPKVKEVTSLENPSGHIGFGCNFRLDEKTNLKFSVIENLFSASPDLTLQTALKLKF